MARLLSVRAVGAYAPVPLPCGRAPVRALWPGRHREGFHESCVGRPTAYWNQWAGGHRRLNIPADGGPVREVNQVQLILPDCELT